MTTYAYDATKLLRNVIGLDNMINEQVQNYPPHNVEKINDDRYILTIAVAGFAPDGITAYVQNDHLFVEGNLSSKYDANTVFLHRGLSLKDFKRKFTINGMMVQNIVLENGLLKIQLERFIPEENKPKNIPITVKS